LRLDVYQLRKPSFTTYPKEDPVKYLTMGLFGEAGEIANQIKKVLRDHGGHFTGELVAKIHDEIGDCLWYCSEICTVLGLALPHKFNVEPGSFYVLALRLSTSVGLLSTAVLASLKHDEIIVSIECVLEALASLALMTGITIEAAAEKNIKKITARKAAA
jgi:NTP pyrophosphatase (non-canonical NTP hydrolase)